jgi:hypothetical protein
MAISINPHAMAAPFESTPPGSADTPSFVPALLSIAALDIVAANGILDKAERLIY